MRDRIALERYLQRHIQQTLPVETFSQGRWRQVLVIPAYREAKTLLATLDSLPAGTGKTVVILVLNRPDSDPDTQANRVLRDALKARLAPSGTAPLFTVNIHTDVYLYDMETWHGPNPAHQGVGLARKAGCDLALRWMTAGFVDSDWICSTDADAILPDGYFGTLAKAPAEAVAAVFPFRHVAGDDPVCNAATALYEMRIRYYLAGLQWAGSPYAHHSLGSCLAVKGTAYAMVHGFPKRAAGEDFYLLNKLAKLGPITPLQGDSVQLQSRHSSRVPFGTGPAVSAIANAVAPGESALFDHPVSFEALRALLAALPQLAQTPKRDITRLLVEQHLNTTVAAQAGAALQALGLQRSLHHCQRQARDEAQFRRQFNQWFDALRTLQFLHGMRDAGWPMQTLSQLQALQPIFWTAQHSNPTLSSA